MGNQTSKKTSHLLMGDKKKDGVMTWAMVNFEGPGIGRRGILRQSWLVSAYDQCMLLTVTDVAVRLPANLFSDVMSNKSVYITFSWQGQLASR